VSLTAWRGRRIADVRDTRNVHAAELKELPFEKQWDRCGHLRTLILPWCIWVVVLTNVLPRYGRKMPVCYLWFHLQGNSIQGCRAPGCCIASCSITQAGLLCVTALLLARQAG